MILISHLYIPITVSLKAEFFRQVSLSHVNNILIYLGFAMYYFCFLTLVFIPLSVSYGDYNWNLIPLATTDFALLLIPFVMLTKKTPTFFIKFCAPVILFLVMSLLAICIVFVLTDSINLSSILSWGYFFKIYFFVLLGFFLLDSKKRITTYLEVLAGGGILVLSTYLFLILSHKFDVYHGFSFFGYGVYGSIGRNSLCVFYALLNMLCYSFYPFIKRRWIVNLFMPLSFLCIFVSLSRQSVVGLVVYYILMLFVSCNQLKISKKYNLNKIFLKILVLLVVVYLFYTFSSLIINIWSYKFDRDIMALANGEINSFSGGRLEIYRHVLNATINHPFFGSVFRSLDINYGTQGLSTHNFYLNVFFKFGLIGLFLIIFQIRKIFVLLKWLSYSADKIDHALYKKLKIFFLVFFIIFCNFQDPVSVITSGSLIFILVGGLLAIKKSLMSSLSGASFDSGNVLTCKL